MRVAASGETGLEMWRAFGADVMLIDIGLPGIDGYAIAQAIRASPGGDGVLLVAITGYGGAHDPRRATAAGFDAHLTKPLNPHMLAQIVQAGREG